MFRIVCFVFALVGSVLPSSVRAQSPYGVDQPEPIGPYMDGVFPTRTPNAPGSSTWAVSAALGNAQFSDVLTITPLPDRDELIVGSRDGLLERIDTVTGARTSFGDFRDRTAVVWDGGFLGLAFHPEFGVPGSTYEHTLYVYYSSHCPIDAVPSQVNMNACDGNYPRSSTGGFFNTYLRLSRVEVTPATLVIDKSTETVLLNIRLYNGSHRGGGMVFGDDGYLYLTVGDQFRYTTAQDITNTLEGGVMRFAVDINQTGASSWTCPANSHQPVKTFSTVDEVSGQFYCIPDDNPWIDPTGGHFEEYYSIGHRNPHRLSKDSVTGMLWSGEVGQSSREEINVIMKGRNYGWPFREGLIAGVRSQPSSYIGILTDPVIDFTRAEARAIIGGYVYRGSRYPELYGRYLAGDYVTRRIWAITLDLASMTATKVEIASFTPGALGTWGQDRNGEVYLGSVAGAGPLYEITRVGTPVPDPPATLSATGFFTDLATLETRSGAVPYDLNQPFWSDGARKLRWIMLPNDGIHDSADETIGFAPEGDWTYPRGTVWAKHFELELTEGDPSSATRLETRFLVKGDDDRVYGVTYRWRPDQSDADLLVTEATEDFLIDTEDGQQRVQTWLYPSRDQCLFCHNLGTPGAIGAATHQLNGEFTYPSGVTDNQLRTWHHLGMFGSAFQESDIGGFSRSPHFTEAASSLQARARSYLSSNCGYCHRPQTGNRAQFDLRWTTPLSSQGILFGNVIDTLGIANAYVISPGSPAESVLWHRMDALDATAMPPLAKELVDQPAVDLTGEWIERIDPNVPRGGLRYEYYEITGMSVLPNFAAETPVAEGDVGTFDISIRNRDSDYAFRYTGVLDVPNSGTYTFYTNSDDGSRLYVDGTLVVDNDGLHPPQERSGTVVLAAGYHDIEVTFFERGGGEVLEVSWEGPGFAKQLVPAGRLYQTPPSFDPDLNYEYYEITGMSVLPDFSTEVPVQTGKVPNFDISVRSRDSDYAFRFTGVLDITNPGTYTFYTNSDDGSRLYLDGTLVVDNDGLHPPRELSGTVALAAGYHDIEVTFFERSGGEVLEVSWEGPGFAKELLPPGRLYGAVPSGAPANDPPALDPPADRVVLVGDAVSDAFTATDADGDSLYFSTSGLPPGLSLDGDSGALSGTVEGPEALYLVTVGVSDGPAVDSTTMGITVLEPSNDTDGDGIPNWWEVEYGYGPLDGADASLDEDGDGLDAVDEYTNGTLPGDEDTDGDGFGDGDELGAGSDPLDPLSVPFSGPSITYDVGRVLVDGTWTTVGLSSEYTSMVVIATPIYERGTPPLVTRVRNATLDSFELRVDRRDGSSAAITPVAVEYFVVDEGVYDVATHGVKMEAVRFESTVTDRKGSWSGEPRTMQQTYLHPVVLGQVMSANDLPSSFWSRGSSRSSPPSSAALYVGKHVGEDPATSRATETIGYVVIETGTGLMGSRSFSAGVSSDIVRGIDNAPGYEVTVAGMTDIDHGLAAQTAEDGGDGGFAVLYGAQPFAVEAFDVVIDEDQLSDNERSHTTEQVAYLVFGRPVSGPPTVSLSATATTVVQNAVTTLSWNATNASSVDIPGVGTNLEPVGTADVRPEQTTTYTVTASGPMGQAQDSVTVAVTPAPAVSLERGSLLATDLWTSVSLVKTYSSPVIVAVPAYDSGPPGVVRVRNVTATGFDIRVERVDGLTGPYSAEVEWMALEEGTYDEATYGVAFEAVKVDVATTDRFGSWNGVSRSYANAYVDPVIIGQVMSANDVFSVFWSRGQSAGVRATSSDFHIGKHVGEDPSPTRATEEIGYIVIEEGTWTVGGQRVSAGWSGPNIEGFDSNPPYAVSVPGLSSVSGVVCSISGMNGNNGGFPIIYGAGSLRPDGFDAAIDEDQLGDFERVHIPEDVAFIAFE